jgi:hypothetical protein
VDHVPTAIGMVLCDQVILEKGTNNVTPVNCFNVREIDSLPGETSFFALAWLADGKGEMLAEIVVERLDTMEETYRLNRKVFFSDRLRETRLIARIRGCNFPIAGQYQISLTIGREFIAHRKFLVKKKGAKNE